MNIREINDRLTGATLEKIEVGDTHYRSEHSLYLKHKGLVDVPIAIISLTFRRDKDNTGYFSTNLFEVIQEMYAEVGCSGNELEIHIK